MTYIPPSNGGRINATISGNTSGAGALVSTGTLTLAGGNNITLSQNGNAITISGGAGGGGVDVLGMSNIGNTNGATGVVSGSAVQYLLAGGNNVTLSQSLNGSSGTLTISAANQTVQTQNLHNLTLSGNTAGVMAQVSSGTLTLAGGNNVTLSQNGNAITISAGNGGGGIAIANSQTTYTSGTANFLEGGGAITIASTTGQSFKVSVPQTSSLSATGAISISTNGSTISIGAPAFSAGISNLGNTSGTSGIASNQVVLAGGNNVTLSQATGAGGNTITISARNVAGTLSRFEYPEGLFTPLSTAGQGSLSINHMYIPFFVTGTAAKIGGSFSAATNTSAATGSVNMSFWMGIYTLNGSTLSLASSGSTNNAFQFSQSASATANTSVNGMRQITVPMNVNMTPGEYWMGAVISSATTYTSVGFTVYGNSLLPTASGGAVLSPIGSTASRDAMLFQGIYTAATGAGPSSIGSAAINNTSASNVQLANFYNVIFNATY